MIVFIFSKLKKISSTFDAISKVYSCRVDDFYTTGNKMVKEFVSEIKSKKLIQENDTKTKLKHRVCSKYLSFK